MMPEKKPLVIQSYLEKGKKYFQEANYFSALKQFNRARDIDPENNEAIFELGKAYYVLKKYPLAIQFLEKARELDSRNEYICILLAKTYKAIGKYDLALKLLLKLKEDGHSTPEINDELSNLYIENLNGEKGILEFDEGHDLIIEGYKQKLKFNPTDERLVLQLAQIYNLKGRYDLTKELASEALKFIPKDNIFVWNKLFNELEIAERKTIIFSKPRRLSITLSNICNLSCIMCLTSKVKWEISRKTIEEIYSLFPYLEKVMWQGGEVFALDFFEEILSVGFQHPNLRHSVVTNGQLITEKMAEKLVKNNVELTFSIDGVSKEVYEYIRRGANFERLIRNLTLIRELKKRHNSNLVLNLNVAIMKSNYHQLDNFIEFGKKYGFEFICIMPINIHVRTPEDIFTNQDTQALTFIDKVSPKIEERARQYGIRLENRLPRFIGEKTNEPLNKTEEGDSKNLEENNTTSLLCHIPWQQLLVDYDGSVRPDCLCRIERNAGYLLEDLTLEDIWNNEVMVEYRKRIVNRDYIDFCNPLCFSGKILESHLKVL